MSTIPMIDRNNNSHVIIIGHAEIEVIIEEAELIECWRALPFIYEAAIRDGIRSVNIIFSNIIASDTYSHIVLENYNRFEHDLYDFINAVLIGISAVAMTVMISNTEYIYEAVVISKDTLALNFKHY